MTSQAKKRTVVHRYDETKIKTLSSLEHIRKRTGMYIGRIGDGSQYEDGIYILLKEVVDNAIDEFIMGYGDRVELEIKNGNVSVRDYGRGIPLGKVVDCVSRINTGAKYNNDVFQFSVGLNGVGTKAVNALSEHFLVRSYREGRYVEGAFEQGKLKREKKGQAKNEQNGTFISFKPDPSIFGRIRFNEEHLLRRVLLYTYLNAGLRLIYNGVTYCSDQGLLDLIREEVNEERMYEPVYRRTKTVELAFTHTRRYKETHFSFVNGQFTRDGGTHLSAFREGILKAFNEYSKKRFEGEDVREGLVGSIAIRLKEPVFESQTKNKLGNTEIRSELVSQTKEIVLDLLHRYPQAAELALIKIQETQKLRKELQAVKKLARERSKSISIRIPQLKDCKHHYRAKSGRGKESMVFITEGQSAAGSIVSCRDVRFQAIFTLKGKPMNVCELKREAIYKNEELYNLMKALNIEENLENLRYYKVILATDADVDGLHIRNLMLTFFLRFFEPLILRGHVYILETPLFRVRNKKETRYCYSEQQQESAMRALGKGCEITRFKGLGEISPSEFKHFIGSEMKLQPVRAGSSSSIPDIISFYMGRNTPHRRHYIMDQLVVDEMA